MKTRRNSLVIINILFAILFLFPIFELDLYQENYSTLSLTTRGYLYVLITGMLLGLLFAYETLIVSNRRRAIFIFLSLLIGTMIPHHVPYNLQGNLHLLCAYIGYAMLVSITYLNIRYTKLKNYYILSNLVAILIYLKCGMVNTLSEIIVMISTMITNLYICIKK